MVVVIILLSVVLVLFLALILTPWSYQVGAGVVGLEKPSFGRAFVTAIIAGVATAIVSSILGAVPVVGGLLAVVSGVLVPAFVIQAVFDTTFTKGLVIEVISMVVCGIVAGIAGLIFFLLGGSLALLTESF